MADYGFIRDIVTAQLREVHTCMPAKVEAYDAAEQTVDVVPQLKNAYPDGEGGHTHRPHPKLANVPVCFPRAGGFFLSFPIQKGDFVLLVFAERSLQAWRDKGQVVEPGDLGMFPLDGAIAIPGVFPASGKLGDADGTNLRMGKDGTGAAQIEITGSEIRLGQGADKAIALAEKVEQDLDTLKTAISSAGTTPQDGGAAFKAAIVAALAAWPSSLGSSNAKAKP